MASSLQGKQDSHLRIISSEDAVVFPENATPTDDCPTVISKTRPTDGQSKHPLGEMTRQSMSPDLCGRRLAHYELIEPIGQGGMAAVIRARDTQLDRFVALKILPPDMALEIENVQRFHQEAKAAAKLDHENIARVFFCGEDQGLHFIAFEYVEGTNLRALLEKRGILPVGEAISCVLQIAAGLEHAATRGVVHRDVKPSNIIITPTGRAKLVDMGLARNLDRHGERDLTQSGVTLGTFDYISPEQALEPREADSRSDLYSLGCTFYHILTGQPPVPEGTPAKKLNHHQHIAPMDPRLINPHIPDEIVAVLGRMMAKNPKDRYQRPILLVHHLMQVAQKLGSATDVPDGMLFLEAPAPNRSRTRPLLVIGLALMCLVAVILMLSFVPDARPPLPRPEPVAKGGVAKKDAFPDLEKKPVINVLPPTPTVVTDAKDLEAVLKDRSDKEVEAKIDGEVKLDNLGLIYQGNKDQRLLIESADSGAHATIAFTYYKTGGATAGLVIDGGEEVVFRRIKFQIDSTTNPKDKAVAAIAIRGARRVRFERCIFIQNVPTMSPEKLLIASVLIEPGERTEGHRPIVALQDCGFEGNSQTGGQAAVALNGPAMVTASSCGFKGHGAFFHVRDKSSAAKTATAIHWKDCAGFVVKGPAFRFDKNASAHVKAEYCVFSNPDGSLAQEGLPDPDLIFLADKTPIPFVGKENRYHNLNYLVGNINKEVDFLKYLALNQGKDEKSVHLDRNASPWQAEDRLGHLAFQLKADFYRAGVPEFGILNSWLGGKMPAPPVAKVTPPMPKYKIVDPDDDNMTPGVFASVLQALDRAVDGDVILVKRGADSREIKVPPTDLKPGVAVTLRAHQGHDPVLVMDKEYSDKESYLFKVRSGRLILEDLEILLDPGTADFDSRSIVQLGEGAQCAFKRCNIRLKSMHKTELHAVTFLDVANMAKMEAPPPPAARAEFSECFVRGKGDLVNLRDSQLLNVEVKHCFIALTGSLLDIKASGKIVPEERKTTWKMDHSSIFTAESVFVLRSETGKGLTKTVADITGCLFVALAGEEIVPRMEQGDALGTYLDWKGEQNVYVGFERWRDWKEMYREPESSKYFADRLTFPKLEDMPQMMRTLWDITPDLLRATDTEMDRMNGAGVPDEIVEKRWMPLVQKTDEP